MDLIEHRLQTGLIVRDGLRQERPGLAELAHREEDEVTVELVLALAEDRTDRLLVQVRTIGPAQLQLSGDELEIPFVRVARVGPRLVRLLAGRVGLAARLAVERETVAVAAERSAGESAGRPRGGGRRESTGDQTGPAKQPPSRRGPVARIAVSVVHHSRLRNRRPYI